MNTLFLVALLALVPLCATAQQYHTTAEQMKILEESKLMYRIGVPLDSMQIEYDIYSNDLILPGAYVEHSDIGPMLRSYNTRMSAEPELRNLQDQAELHFAQRRHDSALHYYHRILELFPENTAVMTYIGQCHGIQKRYDEAKEWYIRALRANPVNYMAHWFLADIYKIEENYSDAVHHITRAHLLNRNNPRLLVALIDIYSLNDTPYDPWIFRPLYALRQGEGHYRDIGLSTDKDSLHWMSYALCKALWAFEPGYSDATLAGARQPRVLVEERECLMSLATGLLVHYDSKPVITLIEFRKLLEAVDNEDFDHFLVYELVLRREPSLALLLEPEALDALAEYIADYHAIER